MYLWYNVVQTCKQLLHIKHSNEWLREVVVKMKLLLMAWVDNTFTNSWHNKMDAGKEVQKWELEWNWNWKWEQVHTVRVFNHEQHRDGTIDSLQGKGKI